MSMSLLSGAGGANNVGKFASMHINQSRAESYTILS